MTIEYTCEGCGWDVVVVVADKVPKHGLCASCAWLCEYVTDPKEFGPMYDNLNPKEHRRGR